MLLDTHREYKTLMDKGFNEKQAEAIADLISRRNDDLATKSDLALLKSELKSDIAIVKKDVEHIKEQMSTKSDIKDLKSEMIKWFVGTQFVTLAIVIAIIGFLK